MLRLTLSKDDYVMIGDDIRLQYDRNTGKGSFSLAVSAPRDIKILRKSIYEGQIQEMAEQGVEEAQLHMERLKEENEERRRVSDERRARQQRYKAQKARVSL